MEKLRLLNHNSYKSKTNDNKATYKQLLNLNRKTKNLHKNENLENFGLGKKDPKYRLDVLGSTNVTGDYYLNNYLLIPTGSIFPYAGNSVPGGYLLCDGNAVSRSTYNRLFQTIAEIYGSGDGSTTFNLPDLRGRTPIGFGQGSGLTNRLLGDIDGEETHTLTTDEIPSHNHTATSGSAGDHSHTINDSGHSHNTSNTVQKTGNNTPGSLDTTSNEIDNINTGVTTSTTTTTGITINNAGSHTHEITVNNTGGGVAHNNMQPYIVINYIIRY